MSNHKNLKFFNKEGDYLNLSYNELQERFEGDILFHENSTDTFKTYAIYTLENIPSFEFEAIGELTTRKFQLFNEYGFHFYGANYKNEKISKIEPVNNDPEFYTKWVYGESFHAKFPIGTIIQFDKKLLEFQDLTQTYVVIGTKVGAIMILTQMDNATFEQNYYNDYSSEFFIQLNSNPSISGLNSVGVYDYVNSKTYDNRLSNWNEPDFYDKYYVGKKLNVIGSDKNDESILTVTDVNLSDLVHFEYSVSRGSLPVNTDLIIEVITKTDVPKLYEGSLKIVGSDIIIDDSDNYPHIMKPGVEFKIVGGSNNNFYTVADIPTFNQINNVYYFATQSQVIYENKIYECLQAYTQSFASSTRYITPEDSQYWAITTRIKSTNPLVDEELGYAQIYLTSDRYYYSYGWTSSSEATLAAAAEKYHTDLEIFNIDLFYYQKQLRADLMYASKYAIVNFYHTAVGPTYSIGTERKTFERLVEVKEHLDYELNYNFSENKRVNIVFTDIDEFGIKVIINGMVYDEEAAILYTGSIIDMERTIDRTLRNWLSRWYLTLFRLGIDVELKYTGDFTSVFYNSILVKSTYPNVPLIVNNVEVGTTADYYIEHSKVLFTDMGPYLNIRVNDVDYGQQTIFSTSSTPDISATLEAWYETHSEFLIERNIRVDAVNALLKFNLSNLETRLDYKITTGKLNLPGVSDFTVTRRLLGNEGVLIASNEMVLSASSSASFEESGFATGMAFTVNNTAYPFVNQDYTIQFLDPNVLNLSYQGPFWDLGQKACSLSGFMTLAFDLGFGQQDCVIPVAPTAATGGGMGEFDPLGFDPTMFSVEFNPNGYTFNSYDLNGFAGTTNLVDLLYLELVSSIYGFGDNFVVIDSFYGNYITTIDLPGNTQSIEMEYNPINSYIYGLSKDYLWIIDPTSNVVISGITFSSKAYQIEVNPVNGDIYVSYENAPRIDIWYSTNKTSTPSKTITLPSGNCRAMVFNDYLKDMFITGTDNVYRIDGSTRVLQTTYVIYGSTSSIFYEPVNESIYVYGGSGLMEISDSGVTQSIASASTYPFTDMIFNNLTGEMNISDSSFNFRRLNLTNETLFSGNIGNFGYIVVNQFDGDVYMSSQVTDSIIVMNGKTGQVNYNQVISAPATKIIYNPERKSVWAIQPSINSFIEVEVDLNVSITSTVATYSSVGENQYGTLSPDYVPRPDVWLKTREYFRRPRENFEGDTSVKLYWKWLTDQTPEFFIYDFTGEQLPTTGPYAYTGPKPLTDIVLNKLPNKDVNRVSFPQYQQTVFDQIEYTLSYIDDEDDLSIEAEPLELFLGFQSKEEGALRSVLQLYKKEEIEFTIDSDDDTYLTFETLLDNNDKRGVIKINEESSEVFTSRGLKEGQHIIIYVKDTTNKKQQYISDNNGIIVIIRSVFTNYLIVDFFNRTFDYLENESTIVYNYPKFSNTTYLKTTIKVKDREIGRFIVYGQSEEEDERFKVELGNVGKLISPDEVFIFKEYDINEGGVDWMILNQKRKELLMNKHEIYPYIGSYKSLINAINYFGYNDLQLNEYYRNLDPASPNFDQLFKVEIPDIFDNTIKGWNEQDFLIKDLPNDNFEATNMFNLTYFITDKEGNYILNYSLDEVIIKLQGLKYWLKRNIIPLTHKILDITGRSYFNGGNQISHNLYDMQIFKINDNMTPITFKLNEVYLMPVNSGSTVYNCVLDFYTIIDGVGADRDPYGLNPNDPKPYYEYKDSLNLPDSFDIKIRTYKIYKEWAPYKNYSKGDKVIYYDKIYESTKDNNKINNPTKYDGISDWVSGQKYDVATIVRWKKEAYTYSGLGDSESTLTPEFDPANWFRLTDWLEIDREPVQTITEFRNGDDLKPFNFTIDSNIDPFIVIELFSHNGYGQVWGDKKNYNIKGLKDITEPYSYIDPIGPFEPIKPVY